MNTTILSMKSPMRAPPATQRSEVESRRSVNADLRPLSSDLSSDASNRHVQFSCLSWQRLRIKALRIFVLGPLLLAGQAMGQDLQRTTNKDISDMVNVLTAVENSHQRILNVLTEEFAAKIGPEAVSLRRDIVMHIEMVREIRSKIEVEGRRFRNVRDGFDYNLWAWIEWVKVNSQVKRRDDYAARMTALLTEYKQRSVMAKERLNQYLSWIYARQDELASSVREATEAPLLSEFGLNATDVGGEMLKAYLEFAERQASERLALENLAKRTLDRANQHGPEAGVQYLLGHYQYRGSQPLADAAHRFLRERIGTPRTYQLPDISERLDLHRRAASVLRYIADNQQRTPLQKPFSILDGCLSVMVRLANILEVPPEERDALDRFVQANAQYSAHHVNIPEFDDLTIPGKDTFVAAKLVELESEIKAFYDELYRLSDKVVGTIFQDVIELRSQWVRDYLLWLKADVESNMARMRVFETHLLENRLDADFDDTDILLEPLRSHIQAEQGILHRVAEASAREKSRAIRTLEEWTASFDDIPFVEVAKARLEGLVAMLLDFEALYSIDPNLYLARCKLGLILSPGHRAILHEKALQFNRLGRYGEAEAILLDLYMTEPARQDLGIALASSYEGQGKTEAAEALFDEMLIETTSIDLSTVDAWLRFAHRHGLEKRKQMDWTFLFRSKLWPFLRMKMNVHTYTGDWLAASQVFEALPDSVRTTADWDHYVQLGMSSDDLYARAMRAASSDQGSVAHRIAMADARSRQGRWEEARELLDAVGLENTPWQQLALWIYVADRTGAEDILARLDRIIDAIENAEARDLLRAYRFIAKGDYGAGAELLQPYDWPAYPYLRFLRARAALGLGDRGTALAILGKLDDEMGFEFLPAIMMKYQLQVLMKDRAEARRTLDRLDGAHTLDCPIRAFYHCLYETRFGSRQEAMRLKNEILATYPDGLAGVSGVWHILPESLALFDRSGTVPVRVWVGIIVAFFMAGVAALLYGKGKTKNGGSNNDKR